MGIFERWTALSCTLLIFATGCDFRGGHGNAGTGRLPKVPETPVLSIATQWPDDQEEEVPEDSSIAIQFDAPLHPDCIRDGLTFLEARGSRARVRATVLLADGNKSLVVRPEGPLATETWYTCHLSPLLCDRHERLLEEDLFFSFKTTDRAAPGVTSVSLRNGATDVPRDVVISVRFDEAIDPLSVTATTVHVRTTTGVDQPVITRVLGTDLHISMARDLAESTHFILTLTGGASGLTDLVGNPLAASVHVGFTTVADTTPPRILEIFPDNGPASRFIHPLLHFSESMDPESIESSAFTFKDEFSNFIEFDVVPEQDQRVIRLVPRAPLTVGRQYVLIVNRGLGAITDLSGNTLSNTLLSSITVAADTQPPRLSRSMPAHNTNRISYNVHPTLDFDEALDPRRVNKDTISLLDENLIGAARESTFVATLSLGNRRIEIIPTTPLRAGSKYAVVIRGGHLGIRDSIGNTLKEDLTVTFHTSTDSSPPAMTISPTHGHSAVSRQSTFSAVFDEALDPASVSHDSVIVTDAGNRTVQGKLTLTNGNRVITFDPTAPYTPGTWYTVTLRNGVEGIRKRSGTWLTQPVQTSFRVSDKEDVTPPDVTVAINDTASRRKSGHSVPRSGFEITVHGKDPVNFDLDLGTFEVVIAGPGSVPSPEQILTGARVTKEGLHFVLPAQQKLAPGEYTVVARVADMAGNYGQSTHLSFKVIDYDASVMPFERTQVVWTRFDLDRDGNGRADFVDDLTKLGLVAAGDPKGTNQRMIDVMREGVLAQTHTIYERKANGGRAGLDSVAVLFTATQPRGISYSEIAFGGLDPNSNPGRGYGDKSAGVLGRAFFDANNKNRADKNIATNPGLGVFGGELFLFEVQTHLSLYPIFITTFAKRFLKLVPQMGGQPAGTHQLDANVLTRGFDVRTAKPAQVRRYYDVFLAADDWATACAVILAHEVGHMVGLVAVGPPPAGLHGDASLHNKRPDLGDVMTSAVGYDSLVHLKYRFRDVNVAYLRQRLLTR